MRTRGPYELNPRQLRALVLLLALLPLVPMAFVIRFVIEDIADQRLEAHERARPAYQRFLEVTTASLVTSAIRQMIPAATLDPDDPWAALRKAPTLGDTILVVAPDRRLSPPPVPPGERAFAPAASLAEAVLDSGMRYATLPPSGPVRWRFFCEVPEPLFALHPLPAGPPGARGSSLLLVKSRQHLLESIGAFYQRELDPQSALCLLDENGESVPLVGAAESATRAGGTPLAECALPPPWPAWRVQLYSVDASLVDGIAHSQVALYWWSVIGMIGVTAAIAAAAGWALTRRLALHELSNDALATVSHEMKTPLASMRMFIETLRERRYRGGPAQADEYLALIAEENARLVCLVEGFQTLTRLDNLHGRQRELPRETVSAEELIASARARLGPRLTALDGAFRVEVSEPPPEPFPGDRDALAAVLVNLLDNAMKYSGEEPNVTLRAFARAGEVVFEGGRIAGSASTRPSRAGFSSGSTNPTVGFRAPTKAVGWA